MPLDLIRAPHYAVVVDGVERGRIAHHLNSDGSPAFGMWTPARRWLFWGCSSIKDACSEARSRVGTYGKASAMPHEIRVQMYQLVDSDDLTHEFVNMVEDYDGAVVELLWQAWKVLTKEQKEKILKEIAE